MIKLMVQASQHSEENDCEDIKTWRHSIASTQQALQGQLLVQSSDKGATPETSAELHWNSS